MLFQRKPTTMTMEPETPAMALPGWTTALDSVQANVMVANLDLELIYANPCAVRTIDSLRDQIREAFGIGTDILGKSIHVFHKNPAAVERILRTPGRLPHEASFTFGSTTLAVSPKPRIQVASSVRSPIIIVIRTPPCAMGKSS